MAWFAGSLLAACGGADRVAPPEACANYIDSWCHANAACELPSERGNYFETCRFAYKLNLDCSKTTSLSYNYQNCIDALAAASCDGYSYEKGISFPDRCKGVLIHD
jgi:hypothetical protein